MVKDKAFYKNLLLIALPVALKSLLSLGVNMLDNIMVGSLGETALSSVALANQVSTLFVFFMNGVAGGAGVLISQYWGKQDVKRIKSVFSVVLKIILCVSVAVTVTVYFFPRQTMGIFTPETDIINEGIQYLTIICFSYIIFALSETMAAMLRCVEIVRISLYATATALFVNLILNYVLIFGKFGFPALGVRGAAIATVCSRVVELCVLVIYVFLIQKKLDIKPKDLLHGEKAIWLDFVRYGAPIIAGDMQWGLVGSFKATIVGRLGTQMIAANNIAETIMSLATIVTAGLGNAACVMIGKTVGAKEYDKTRSYSNTLQILFAMGGALMCTLLFAFRAGPVSLYNIEPETAALARTLIGVGAVTLLGTFYHATCFTGINRGAGDGKFVFKVDMVCGWLIVLPLSALGAFVFGWPLPVIFLCLRIDQCFKWLIAFFRLRGDRWIRNVTRE